MTTKIYFKVIWIFKDGRNSVSSDFSVDIYEDIFESIQHTDMEDHTHVYKQFTSSFRNVFPQFNNKDYKMTALRPSVWSGADILIIDPSSSHCFEVVQLIRAYKKTCNNAEGAILLKIEQRRRSQEPSVTNALTATIIVCRECNGSITGITFQCVECEDYNMCCLCVTYGKHTQHTVIRNTGSEVDRDTVAKLRSIPVEIKKEDATEKSFKKWEGMEAKIKVQDAKIKEQDVEIKRLVAARSEAMACLFQPCDRTSSPENKKRKSEASQGVQNKNIKVEVIDVE